MVASALSSLMFDCEVTLAADDVAQASSMNSARDAHLVVQRLEMLSRASCPFARELRYCIQRMSTEACGGDTPDVQALSRRLASLGYVIAVRTALPGNGAECFKSLRHEFLVVRGTGEYTGMEFIVEPALRQHFTIPHPSPDYTYVLSRAPDVYVGGSCRLVPIVQLLCALMADSFQRQGLALPPWRKEAAMLSKWLPQPHRARDMLVTSAASAAEMFSTAAAAPAAAPLSYRYVAPPPAVGYFFPDEVEVCRTNSASSNVSSAEGGSCVMDEGCSPVSVLPVRLPGIDPASGSPFTTAGNFCAVRGFEPPPGGVGVGVGADLRLSMAEGGPLEDEEVFGFPGGCGGNGVVQQQAHNDSGSYGSGESSSNNSRAGLLSLQLQQRLLGGCSRGRISTRPPAHRGEMSIRVVKLVGFAVPEQPQKKRPQQPQQLAPPHDVQGGPAMVPWRLLRGGRAA